MLRKDLYLYLKDVLNYEVKQGFVGNTPDNDIFITIYKEPPIKINSYNKNDVYSILVYSKIQDYSIVDTEINNILNNLKPSFTINNNKYKPLLVSETGDLKDKKNKLIYKGISMRFPIVL